MPSERDSEAAIVTVTVTETVNPAEQSTAADGTPMLEWRVAEEEDRIYVTKAPYEGVETSDIEIRSTEGGAYRNDNAQKNTLQGRTWTKMNYSGKMYEDDSIWICSADGNPPTLLEV